MDHDNDVKSTNAAVIPIPNMINGSSVIFFGEDPGFVDDTPDHEDLREENIRRLSR